MGPVFFALVFALQACTPHAVQAPTLALEEVHSNGAHRVEFDSESRRLASGGLHGRVHVWSLADGLRLRSFGDHHSRITGLAWTGPNSLLSADRSGRLLLRDLDSGHLISRRTLPTVAKLAVSPDATWLAVISDGALLKLSLPELKTLADYRPPSAPLALAIDPLSGRIALSTKDALVQLLTSDLEPLKQFTRPSRKVYSLVFSPDGKTLLGGGWFRLLVWEVQSGKLDERSTEHLGKINSVDISPDGLSWISLGRETGSNFRLVDAQSNRVLRRFKAHKLCGQEARFSPDGRYVTSSSDDGSIHIYDLTQPYTARVPYLQND